MIKPLASTKGKIQMSFLSKLGQIVATVTGLAPLFPALFGSAKVTQAVTVGVNDFNAIAQVIVQVETALQGKTGADKFTAAVNLVGPIIRTSQLVSGKKIADEALLQKGINEVTQGVVDVLNSIHSDAAK
jgi:hypothetical protein